MLEKAVHIGILTDLHYDGGVLAMNRLYEAVASLRRSDADGLVVMGDLVNGDSAFSSTRLLREVSALIGSFEGPVLYMPGNHDLDFLSKSQFYDALDLPGHAAQFRETLGGLDVICIDGNFSPDETEYNCGNFNWEESYVPEAELNWLVQQVSAAREPVLIFSHQRIDLAGNFSVENHTLVRDVFRRSGKVAAVFQGHQHEGDLNNINGTAYYTLDAHVDDAGPAMVEIEKDGVRLVRDFHPLQPA